MKKYFRQKNTQQGFTLIETLVAIFILLISTTGPLSFAQSGLRASFLARDQVVAFYLAQDATETIKNLRDNNSLIKNPWLTLPDSKTFLSECSGDGCRMQTGSDLIIEKCTSTTCNPMHYDKVKREFVLDSNSDTIPSKYTRTIYFTDIVPNREAQIIVKVKWDTTFFSEREIVVQENIYNWIPAYVP